MAKRILEFKVDNDQVQILLNLLEQRAYEIGKYVMGNPVSKHTDDLFKQRDDIYDLLQQIDRTVLSD
jgi:hypothetical protein